MEKLSATLSKILQTAELEGELYNETVLKILEAMREPTEAMKNAGYLRDWEAAEVWEYMIDAAIKEATE